MLLLTYTAVYFRRLWVSFPLSRALNRATQTTSKLKLNKNCFSFLLRMSLLTPPLEFRCLESTQSITKENFDTSSKKHFKPRKFWILIFFWPGFFFWFLKINKWDFFLGICKSVTLFFIVNLKKYILQQVIYKQFKFFRYSCQSGIVDHIFPPLNCTTVHLKADSSPTAQLEYSHFAFWRDPLPEIEDPESSPPKDLSSTSSSPSSPTKETAETPIK